MTSPTMSEQSEQPVEAAAAAAAAATSVLSEPLPLLNAGEGATHPRIGFGTYKVGFIPASASSALGGQAAGVIAGQDVKAILQCALTAGYRLIDCAEYYGNEQLIGEALAACDVPRDQLFVVSKVWTSAIYEGREAVRAHVLASLKALQMDYVDAMLVHWPVPGKFVDAYKELLSMQEEGLVRCVGISNATIEDIQELTVTHGLPMPAINQIEANPGLFRKDTIAWMQERGIVIQAYRSLGNGKLFAHPVIVQVAEEVTRTPAQVLGRWCVQHGLVYLPKSTVPERINANLQVTDFALSDEQMEKLDALTEPKSFDAFADAYRKGVVRDTPFENNKEKGTNGPREKFTVT